MTRLDVGLLELRAKSIDEILEKAQILKQKADSVDAVVKDLEVSDSARVCICMRANARGITHVHVRACIYLL